MGALQKEIKNVGKPKHVENTGDPKEHHGVSRVWPVACMVAPFGSFHLLAGKACPSLVDLSVVLLADAEDVEVRETDHQGRRGIQQAHNKASEECRSGPRVGTPFKDIPMVPRLTPAEERREKHHARVDPYENDAAAKAAGCYQLVVGEGLGNSQIAVHTNASQTSHRNALEYRDDVAEHLTGEGFLDTSWVVEQGKGGNQAT